jgi:hypothetical protein
MPYLLAGFDNRTFPISSQFFFHDGADHAI